MYLKKLGKVVSIEVGNGHCKPSLMLQPQLKHTSTGKHVLKLNFTPKIGLGEGRRYYSPSSSIKINQA